MPMEEVIRFKFIPSIAGGHICSSDKPVLLSLPARLGGLGIPLFHVLSLKTREGSHQYIDWFNQRPRERIWTTIKTERENIHKNVLNSLQNRLNGNQLRLNFINPEEGVLSWLTSYPWIRSNKAAILVQPETKIRIGSTEYAVYMLLQCKDWCSACNKLQKRRIQHNDIIICETLLQTCSATCAAMWWLSQNCYPLLVKFFWIE